MPRCIFCDTEVPHRFNESSERSLCLDCLVEMRRFELQNAPEITERIFPQRVVDALRRIKYTDPDDPANKEQLKQDLRTVREAIPY